jgi:hypothetical protein
LIFYDIKSYHIKKVIIATKRIPLKVISKDTLSWDIPPCFESSTLLLYRFFFHLFICFLYFYCHIVVLSVHCDIYNISYNISQFNSPLHHSLLSPSLHSWNSFSKSHFSILMHKYVIFLPPSSSYIFSLYPPHSHWYQPPARTYFTLLFSIF